MSERKSTRSVVRGQETSHYSLDDLVQFGLVAEAGGIGAASRRHGVTKASLSRAIARLENSAGIALFDRVGRGLKLTEFGKLLVDRARDAARVARDTECALLAQLGEPHGLIRIGSNAHTTLMLAAVVVSRLQKSWPEVQSSLRLVTDDLNCSDEHDVLLSVGRPSDPRLVSRRVLTFERGLYASAEAAAEIDINCFNEVSTLPRVVVGRADEELDWRLTDRGGACLEMDGSCPISVPDASIALCTVLHGFGMTVLPRMMVENSAKPCKLIRLLPRFSCNREIYVSFMPHRTAIPVVREFVDMLVEYAESVDNQASPPSG